MSHSDDVHERLAAVERAVAGDGTAAPSAAAPADSVAHADCRERIDRVETRLADVEAATEALRGYVGTLRSIERDLERHANVALAAAERLAVREDGATAPTEPTASADATHATGASHAPDASEATDADVPEATDATDTDVPDTTERDPLAGLRDALS